MSVLREIPVDMLLPPETPARVESTAMKFEELCQSISRRGLLQPIGVTDQGNGFYQIRWGLRRSLAHRELGKKTIQAIVFQSDEGDAEDDMLTENFQRTEMSEAEEMRAFLSWMRKHKGTIHGCAVALNVSDYRVRNALVVADGPPEVRAAFEEGKISVAVAVELCQVSTKLHTTNLLFHAIKSNCSAKFIRAWREQLDQQGAQIGIEHVEQVIAEQSQINYANTLQCRCCSQFKPYSDAAVVGVCHGCWDALMELRDQAVAQAAQEAHEGNNGTGDVVPPDTEHLPD